MSRDESDTLVGECVGRCPFCTGDLAVSEDPPSIMHSLPMCTTFQRLDPIAFARAVNQARST